MPLPDPSAGRGRGVGRSARLDALREEATRFRASFDLAPAGMAHLSLEGAFLAANARLCELLGYEAGELARLRVQQLAYPEAMAADLDVLLHRVAGGLPTPPLERRYRCKDGHAVWARLSASLIRDERGAPFYFVAVVEDVTARRLAELALAEREADLRRALESSPDIISRFDRDGRHTYVNPAVERATGLTPDAFIGRTNRELGMPEALAAEWERGIRHVFATGEPYETWFTFPAPDGTARQYWGRVVPERDAHGAVVSALSTARDVTAAGLTPELVAERRARELAEEERAELARVTEALREARDSAEAANRSKGDFLAAMSHELRTPLNAIQGYSQLMEMELYGPMTEAQREALRRIERSQQHLVAMVGDILSFAKLEGGRLEFAPRPLPLAPALQHAAGAVEPQLSARGLRLVVLPPDAPVDVVIDPERFQQVLLNLLTNAAKFTEARTRPDGTTEPGRVTLSGHRPPAAGVPAGMAAVRVHDTGRGIPAAQLAAIFDPFVQVDRHRTPAPLQGVGLGLAISRELARAMGGDLTVESVEGEGSTFTVLVPLAAY